MESNLIKLLNERKLDARKYFHNADDEFFKGYLMALEHAIELARCAQLDFLLQQLCK